MKYAKVQKNDESFVVLVGFGNKGERDDQELRFGYEFPEGTFVPVDYYTARREFGFRSEADFSESVEMCNGKSFPCMLSREGRSAVRHNEAEVVVFDALAEEYGIMGGAIRI